MRSDSLGGKPLTLVQLLRLIESKIHGWKKQKQAGQEYTVPTISNEGEITEPQLLDDLINHWQKEKTYLENIIAWAEKTKPSSSREENGEQLIREYEKLFKKD